MVQSATAGLVTDGSDLEGRGRRGGEQAEEIVAVTLGKLSSLQREVRRLGLPIRRQHSLKLAGASKLFNGLVGLLNQLLQLLIFALVQIQ
jgi:hypothetical protein